MSPAVEFSNVTVAFHQTVALQDVSFTISRGEFLGVIGPNGSGKTTLLKTILGLIKPVTGRVTVLGASGRRIGGVRSRIGYVPQRKPIDVNFPVNALDAVLMGSYGRLGWLRYPKEKEKANAQAVLAAVGLEESAFHTAGHLSGGQQQRLFLARALVGEPDVLLLDEPTAGVDVASRGQIVELVRRVHQERQLTTIYVTHDVNEVLPCVDRVMFLNRTIQLFGNCNAVLNPEVLSGLYGIPVTVVEESGRKFFLIPDRHA
ncbi:MAG: metal ABC transporter ATP-binding protein [bacterium]